MHAHPVTVGVTLAAVVVITAYNYGPTLFDYAKNNTQCYVDGRGDYRVVLRLDNLEPRRVALRSGGSGTRGWRSAAQALVPTKPGWRRRASRSFAKRGRSKNVEREEQERKEQEETAKRTKISHPGYKATGDATQERVDQREQAQSQGTEAGTHVDAKALERLKMEQEMDEEVDKIMKQIVHMYKEISAGAEEMIKYAELPAAAEEIQQFLAFVVL